MHKSRKFKNYFIYPKFQFSLILSNMLVGILCMFIVHYLVVQFFDQMVEYGVRSNLLRNDAYFEFISKSKDNLLTSLNWILLLSVTLSTMLSVYYSHKAAGPIHRLKLFFTQLDNGGTNTNLQFRKDDFFLDLPVVINSVLSKFKSRE